MKLDFSNISIFATIFALANLLILLALITLFVILGVLSVKALLKYLIPTDQKKEKADIKKSLGEVLKQQREACNMTQEFVAQAIGVSRQAVSKWETGASEPGTSNLIALANLFKISIHDLLTHIQSN